MHYAYVPYETSPQSSSMKTSGFESNKTYWRNSSHRTQLIKKFVVSLLPAFYFQYFSVFSRAQNQAQRYTGKSKEIENIVWDSCDQVADAGKPAQTHACAVQSLCHVIVY